MKLTNNITLTAILLFTVGCASKPPAISSTKDHPENVTNNVSQETPAEIAPMTEQERNADHIAPAEIAPMTEPERNYYKDNAKGKLLLDAPK